MDSWWCRAFALVNLADALAIIGVRHAQHIPKARVISACVVLLVNPDNAAGERALNLGRMGPVALWPDGIPNLLEELLHKMSTIISTIRLARFTEPRLQMRGRSGPPFSKGVSPFFLRRSQPGPRISKTPPGSTVKMLRSGAMKWLSSQGTIFCGKCGISKGTWLL